MMKDVAILDCTLRDGGYCNKWNFGEKNIHRVIKGLVAANVDIIECGYITNKSVYLKGATKFTQIEQIREFVPEMDAKQLFVAMVNYGEFDVDQIPTCEETALDGIRVAFHKKDLYDAMDFCRKIKDKGYLVFTQPMITMTYSDDEFYELLDLTNEVMPYAFYVVDSFGTMRKRSLLHYFGMAQKKLQQNITIGFHSHNNFQAAYANAASLLDIECHRQIIIDVSVYGMGRGAGNLNTELFLNELNTEYSAEYQIKPILQLMDEVINRFYEENPWGYSLPNYLSAAHLIHPNYANYLCRKNTLTLDAIDDIFHMINKEKASEYDAAYIETLYEKYMSRGHINNTNMEEFKRVLTQHSVLLIAPGKSSDNQKEFIKAFSEKYQPIIISVNHEYKFLPTDYIFVSNMRRFREIPEKNRSKVLVTSNIESDDIYMKIDYYSLLNSSKTVKDNAGLMALRFMINLGCREIFLAGFDGYEYDTKKNYENRDLELAMSCDQIDDLNKGMGQVLEEISKEINIKFITESRFSSIVEKMD